MVVRVRLDGLNVVKARGRWYVYVRETGEALERGFAGTRADLDRKMAEPAFLDAYNHRRKRDLKRTFADGTLGALIQWFEHECPRWQRLSEATRKDYTAAFAWLSPGHSSPVRELSQSDLYGLRDTCAREKWPRFADKMISALSSMFSEAVKRGKMDFNPATGMDKAAKADPNANREWTADEWQAAIARAPADIATPLMLARYAGFRGQTIAALLWRNYQPDPRFGHCFRVVARKNAEPTWVPAAPELAAYLAGLVRPSMHVATRGDGQPWANEKVMQTAVSHFLRALEREGVIGAGTTLHGLRVTYAADLRRGGAASSDIAAALGDRSERMGEHYTRHVENEARVIRAFEGKKRA